MINVILMHVTWCYCKALTLFYRFLSLAFKTLLMEDGTKPNVFFKMRKTSKQEFVGHFWHEELCEISTFCFFFSFSFFVLFFVVVISIIICFWILFCILICFCILIFICIFEVNELGTQEDSCSGSSGLCIHSELKKFSGLNSTDALGQPLWIIIMGGLHMT